MADDLAVVGLGYVGLSLAREAVTNGLAVTGYDLDPQIVAGLNSGRSHVDDVSDDDVQRMLRDGFTASTNSTRLAAADSIVIAVPTPLGPDGGPDLRAVIGASTTIASYLRP